MLPNLVVVGAMKAGTTALHQYLAATPGVFMSEPKELDFFVASGNWQRGTGWYEQRFEAAGDAMVIGESSPNYTKRHLDDGVASRMKAVIPEVRLVYVVRDPIDRIVSMYRHLVQEQHETRPFARAVLEDPDYVATSRYAWQLEPYLEEFGRSRVLIVRASDLRRRRGRTVRRVLHHAGAPGQTPEPEALGQEPNVGRERRVPRPVLGRLAEVAPYRRLLERSWRLRRIDRIVTTRRAPRVPVELTAVVRDELRSRLCSDVGDLVEMMPAGFDGWGLLSD